MVPDDSLFSDDPNRVWDDFSMTASQLLQGFREGRWMALGGRSTAIAVAAPRPRGVGEQWRRQWWPADLPATWSISINRRMQPLTGCRASVWILGCDKLQSPPLHHVSGLMPWWRSRCWGSPHLLLEPWLLKQPQRLVAFCQSQSGWGQRPAVLSLVPTQLGRLLADPSGVAWLQGFSVIWVGGAALPAGMADRARQAGIRLAPCYGATETAAMVAALPPERFLQGEDSCGAPLKDVELRLGVNGALEVRTGRLAIACWRPEQPELLQGLRDGNGWWCSGDRAALEANLQILGRLDGAVTSGGETVFPEQLEARLMALDLPLEAVLLLGVPDADWGERLVGLVRSSTATLLNACRSRLSSGPLQSGLNNGSFARSCRLQRLVSGNGVVGRLGCSRRCQPKSPVTTIELLEQVNQGSEVGCRITVD